MSQTQGPAFGPAPVDLQPCDVRGLAPDARDALIVSMIRVDGAWKVLARYGADRWELVGGTTNLCPSSRILDFSRVPEPFFGPR